MKVVTAQLEDFSAWLHLAREVEFLFGPMVAEPSFHRALLKNINRETAFCIRELDGAAGHPLLGGILFSPEPPLYTIGWLAVAQAYRRGGIGQRLVEYVMTLVQPPAEMKVTTFGKGVAAGLPARRFYERMGFHFEAVASPGPEGGSPEIGRLILT
jgi:GNAT superfamily N-acetyltransferase